MRVEIMPSEDVDEQLAAEIDYWDGQSFQNTPGGDIEWSGGDWRVIVWDGDRWVSSLEIADRDLKVGDVPMRVGGLSGVMTPEPFRRKGYASAAVRAATEFICQQLRREFALLVTGTHLIPFYSAAGWVRIPGPVAYDVRGEKRTFSDDTIIMIYSCTGRPWPSGIIDLCGKLW